MPADAARRQATDADLEAITFRLDALWPFDEPPQPSRT